MKRPTTPPPAEAAQLVRQKADFTNEGAPVVPKPALPTKATSKPAVPKAIAKGPAVRKGPPQGRYG